MARIPPTLWQSQVEFKMRVYRDSQSPKSLVSKCFTMACPTKEPDPQPLNTLKIQWSRLRMDARTVKEEKDDSHLKPFWLYEGTENCLLVLAGSDKKKQAPPIQTVKFTFTNLNQQARSGIIADSLSRDDARQSSAARSGIKRTASGMSTISPFILPSNFCWISERSICQLRMLRMVARTAREFIILVLSAQQIGLKSHPLWLKRTTYYPPSKALWTNKYPCLACASCQSQPFHLAYQRACGKACGEASLNFES